MKTKDFNVENELKKIAKKIGDNETLFAIYLNEDEKDVSVLTTGDDDTNIIYTFAAMLELSLKGKGDEGMDRVTNIIIEALKLVQKSRSIAGLKLATELLKGILEKDGLLNNDDDDEDDEIVEDCEVVVLDKEGGYHEIEDVLFSKHASGVLTVTIVQGEKFLY